MSFQSLLITENDTRYYSMNTGFAKRLHLFASCSSLSCHMSAGATLQNYNNDLVACIEEVRAPSHRPRTTRDQGLRLTCRNAHAPGSGLGLLFSSCPRLARIVVAASGEA